MKWIELVVVAGLACCNNFAIAGNYAFRTWFEMPESVVAGESFDVWLRVSLESNGELVPTGVDTGWMSTVFASIEVGGELSSFESISSVLDGLDGVSHPGVSDGPWLRDFLVFQDPRLPLLTIDYSNPVSVAMFRVSTVSSSHGILTIDLRPSGLFGNQLLLSWFSVSTNSFIDTSLEPDIEVISETGVIRVIPAPASIALLAPLALACTRCRRSPATR